MEAGAIQHSWCQNDETPVMIRVSLDRGREGRETAVTDLPCAGVELKARVNAAACSEAGRACRYRSAVPRAVFRTV
jgi:hypothetical protein